METETTNFKNKTIADFNKEFGKAEKVDSFKLSNNLPEFRIELLNFYSKKDIEKNKTPIKELTWRIDENKLITIWFSQKNKDWKYVHHLNWNRDDEF